MWVPEKYECTHGETELNSACSQNPLIPCWVSRPWEKTIFMLYMTTVSPFFEPKPDWFLGHLLLDFDLRARIHLRFDENNEEISRPKSGKKTLKEKHDPTGNFGKLIVIETLLII